MGAFSSAKWTAKIEQQRFAMSEEDQNALYEFLRRNAEHLALDDDEDMCQLVTLIDEFFSQHLPKSEVKP